MKRLPSRCLLILLLVSVACSAMAGRAREVVEVFPPGVKPVGRVDRSAQSVPDDATIITLQILLRGFGGTNTTEFGAEYSIDGGSSWQLLTFGRTPPSDRRPGARSSIESAVSMRMPAGTGRLVRSWLTVEGNQLNSNMELVYD